MTKEEIIEKLRDSKTRLLEYLSMVIQEHPFDYKTFGTAIEDHLIEEVVNILSEAKVIQDSSDYQRAKNKNEFPDLRLLKPELIALEVKSGNHSKKDGEKWVECKNSNNDMGTLNSWGKKIDEFGGENIYYIFIEYNFNGTSQEILDIKIEPFYKFLGLNKEGTLKYREKDGNLRPKNFDAESKINSFEEFSNLIPKTETYRSRRIIKKHYKSLPEEERGGLLE